MSERNKKQNAESSRQKCLVVALALLLLTAFCVLPSVSSGQDLDDLFQDGPVSVVTPALRESDRLRIRDLQYQQDKVLIEMKKLEARYAELDHQQQSLQQQMEAVFRDAAGQLKIDVNKWALDLDTLRIAPRPQPVGAASPSPSPSRGNSPTVTEGQTSPPVTSPKKEKQP